jgi:two-component system, NarL family, sensor kinase
VTTTTRARPARTPSTRRIILTHVAVSTTIVLAILAGATYWSWHLIREQAIRQSALVTEEAATTSSTLVAALQHGDTTASNTLDTQVHQQLVAGPIVDVVIARADGTVLYASQPVRTGTVMTWPDPQAAAQSLSGPVDAAPVSVVRGAPTLPGVKKATTLTVYTGFTPADGPRTLFLATIPLSRLDWVADELRGEVLPIALVTLLILELIQVPFAVRLIRATRQAEQDRHQAIARGAVALTAERKRLARFLHDEIVPDLAGVGMALDAMPAVMRLQPANPDLDRTLNTAAETVRRDVGLIRTILTDVYPDDLEQIGLTSALDHLLAPVRETGTTVTLHVEHPLVLPPSLTGAIYSIVREAARNTRHANARTVDVIIARQLDTVQITITDDGIGFDPEPWLDTSAATNDGGAARYGLTLMAGLIHDAEGTLTITSDQHGTRVHAQLPIPVAHRAPARAAALLHRAGSL